MSYPGIDYSNGHSNFDLETGIHFGVISCHSLMSEAIYEAQDLDYGEPTCPKCGNAAVTIPSHTEADPSGEGKWVGTVHDIPAAYEEYESAKHECFDYACEECRYLFGAESAFSEEALGWSIDDGKYKVVDCLDSDAMILRAPYYTYAQYCSPCVPGAGNLDNPVAAGDGGAKCYCFGHSWFEDGAAPYPVYSVADNSIVSPEKE